MFSKRYLYTIVVILSLALVGLIVIQVYWIKNAYKTEEEQYKQDVNQALVNVSNKLDKEQYSDHLIAEFSENVMEDVNGKISFSTNVVHRDFSITDSLIQTDEDTTFKRIISGSAKDSARGITAEARIIKDDNFNDSLAVFNLTDNQLNRLEVSQTISSVSPKDLMNRIHIVSDILLRSLDPKSYEPAENRIELDILDSMISTELANFGIDADFEFSIADGSGKIFDFSDQKSERYNTELTSSEFSQYLFPGDVTHIKSENTILLLSIDGKAKHLFSKIWWIFVLSSLFILIIIYAFYYTVSTINKQKKLSLIKNDFINNMTHELKTPISTISLACEALSDPDFNSEGKINTTYLNMIRDENVRLGVLVERVLQSAVIEKGTLNLKREPIDFHGLISEVSKKFNFQIERNGGILNLNLAAKQYDITGDRVHLTNLLYNLLDNACKYSKEAPQISISTKSGKQYFEVSVADKGIGISKEHQKKVFDKLFRVPTGNVHDVKGFGLGLSYVKAIVDKHNGHIELNSEPNNGSTFTLKFPYKYEEA